MKSEEEVREKLEEADEASSEALRDSHGDQQMNAVNRGAMYGWEEALAWVVGDESDTGNEEEPEEVVGVLRDALTGLSGAADELDARDDVDDHLRDQIRYLRHHAQDVQEWLNEHYYEDPIEVVDGE